MKRTVAYLKYVLKHKYYVFVASRKYKCSLWRAFTHDMSKFLPDEWLPYAATFYDQTGNKQYEPHPHFDMAWFKHKHRNLHHWENWLVLDKDKTSLKVLEMTEEYAREMVADWAGAGKAITGAWEVVQWYEKEKHKIVLHESTRKLVEALLGL